MICMNNLKGFNTIECKKSESWGLESISFSAHTLCSKLMHTANPTLFELNQLIKFVQDIRTLEYFGKFILS